MGELAYSIIIIQFETQRTHLRRKFLIISYLFFLLIPSLVNATTYYVAKTGSNSNPGTLSSPVLTITRGISLMKTGDTLFVRTGTYVEIVVIDKLGTENNPVVVMAYPGEYPVINGGGTLPGTSKEALVSLYKNYTQFIGFEVTNVNMSSLVKAGGGINAASAHCLVSHCTVHNCKQYAIRICDYGIAEYCTAYDCCMDNKNGGSSSGYGAGISANRTYTGDTNAKCDYATIRHCIVHDVWGEQISTYEATHTTIEDNISYNGWDMNLYISDATDCLIQRNFIYDTKVTGGTQIGIFAGDEGKLPNSARNTFINNIIYNCRRNFYIGDIMTDIIIANNTFVNSSYSCNVQITPPSLTNSSFRNNIIIQEGDLPCMFTNIYTGMTWSNNLYNKSYDTDAVGTGDVTDDPLIAKTGSTSAGELSPDYFKLLSTSPAINKGTVLSKVTNDIFGNTRDATPDIGAIEYYTADQAIKVASITVTGAGGTTTISADKGTLQLSVAVSPSNATNKTVTWSIANGTGQGTVSSSGLVTAISNGAVTVKATANDGSGIYGSLTITISNQGIPAYVSSVIQNSTPTKLEITYSIALGNNVPATSAFTVTINSVARAVNSVAVSGTSVTLTLISPIVYGDAVTVAYSKPSSYPLQTAAGGQVVSFSAQKVTNNVAAVPVPAYVSISVENATPSKINIVYTLSLANIVPPVSAFAVTVNSAARTVNSVAVSGTTVILTLVSAVAYGDAAKVAYTKPSSNPLQTAAGGQAASFTAQTVSNNVQLNNTAPVVMVNYKSTTYSGFVNELNASGSYDPNNDNLTFSWVVPANIPVSSTTGSTIQYLNPVTDAAQKVQFVLNVSDGKTIQSKTVPIEILPYEPGLDMAEVAKVEASGYLAPNYPANIIDGNIGTMWASNGDNEWILLELKAPFTVQHVDLAFQPGQKKESIFDILGSNDLNTWEPILSKSNSCAFSGALQVFDFPASKTDKEFKYIKVIGHGNSTDSWNYISEFRIFGYKHINPTSYEELPVKIYPNPARDFFNVKIEGSSIIYDLIRIVSFTGKILLQEKIDPSVSEFRVPINLLKGIYLIQMGAGNITLFSQKLVVSN